MAHLLDDQADHLGGGDDLYEEGGFELTTRSAGSSRRSPTSRVFTGGSDIRAGHRARPRADADLAPAHPHRGADLRLHALPPGRRDLPRARVRVGHATRAPTSPACLRAWARAAAAVPARDRMELLGGHRRARVGWSRWCPASRWTSSCASRIFAPLGMNDTAFFTERRGTGWRPVHAGPGGTGSAPRSTRRRGGVAPPSLLAAAAGWSRRRPTTTGSPRCCCGQPGGELDGVRLLGAADGGATWPATICPAALDLAQFGRPLTRETRSRHRLRARVLGRHRPGGGQGLPPWASTAGAARPARRSGSTRPRS